MSAHADLELPFPVRSALHPMLAVCPAPGCTRLTMGGTCVEHDAPVAETFPRGRPFVSESGLADSSVVAPV